LALLIALLPGTKKNNLEEILMVAADDGWRLDDDVCC
jgi:hypothetical protein